MDTNTTQSDILDLDSNELKKQLAREKVARRGKKKISTRQVGLQSIYEKMKSTIVPTEIVFMIFLVIFVFCMGAVADILLI